MMTTFCVMALVISGPLLGRPPYFRIRATVTLCIWRHFEVFRRPGCATNPRCPATDPDKFQGNRTGNPFSSDGSAVRLRHMSAVRHSQAHDEPHGESHDPPQLY